MTFLWFFLFVSDILWKLQQILKFNNVVTFAYDLKLRV